MQRHQRRGKGKSYQAPSLEISPIRFETMVTCTSVYFGHDEYSNKPTAGSLHYSHACDRQALQEHRGVEKKNTDWPIRGRGVYS